jgi:hypothetical protein
VLRELCPGEGEATGAPACETPARAEEWWRRFDAECGLALGSAPESEPPRPPVRKILDRRGSSGVACVAGLLSTGASVLALCADVSRRRGLAERAAAPVRFGGGRAVLACARCALAEMSERVRALAATGPGLVLADWGALTLDPSLPSRFGHVVLVDPPPSAHLEGLAGAGEGYLHLAWGDAEVELALRVHDSEWPLRQGLAATYRALREAATANGGAATAEPLVRALAGDGKHPRTPEQAARRARVLDELGLLRWHGSGTSRTLGVVSSEGQDLERSEAFRAYRARHEEGKRFLRSKRQRRR